MIDIVYVEKDALDIPFTKQVLPKLPRARVIVIDRWEDVFYRKKQNYALQMKNRKLIIGVNRENFVMKGSDNCQSAGSEAFYYCSFAKNCIGGCDYCYLRGMLRSGYLLAFANMQDCFEEVREIAEKEGKTLIALSYDNDVYALEGLFGYVGMWADLARSEERPGLTFEIRTKCGTKIFIDKAAPAPESLVFTWSVSSAENIKRFERGTSSLKARLDAAEYALEKGFRVRLALDPVIAAGENWRKGYEELCREIGRRGIGKKIDAVMTGGFRIPADYLKILRRNMPDSLIALDDYEVREGTAGYPPAKEKLLVSFVLNELENSAGVPKDRIFVYGGEEEKR